VEEPLLDAVDRNSPDSVFILEALCQGYMEKDSQPPRVLRCLNLWLERNPRAVQALIWRGDLRYSSQDSTGAISDYKRALEIDPENDDTHLHLAVVLFISHTPSEAAEHYQRVLTRQRDNDAALFGLALCCRDLDQANRACQLLDTLLQLQPEHAAAARERGNLALSAGQLSLAEHWLRRAVRLDPDDKIANLLLYRCLTRLISRPALLLDPWAWLSHLVIQLEADAYRARYVHLSGKKRS
jgi:tetratricopeptide (TPR) repeat protein